jgi:hypothetical protein
MPLSWNEIRARAAAFAAEWQDASDEHADAKSFWDALFQVYGVPRRRVATFETRIDRGGGGRGFVDLLWKRVVLVEHKSRGRNLDRAHEQAKDYFPGIRDTDLPRYIVVCDFDRFRVTDLEQGLVTEFRLRDLPDRVQALGFIAGYEARTYKEQDPVNIEAALRLGTLHDELRAVGYEGHELEVYLVRLLFCLFADDTGIFVPRDIFDDHVRTRTLEDGSDLGPRLQELFETLNRPVERRYRNLDESLRPFPFVNGELFREAIPVAPFTGLTRTALLECCEVDWGRISPAIFGSLFQSIKSREQRRHLGEHYTSEQNIMKAVQGLFLDALRSEFEGIRHQVAKLRAFHDRLAGLRFLDPACGCGNFLVIAYRELRLLELDVIQALYGSSAQQLSLDAIAAYVKVDVDQFHGIEIEEWPAQIARVAMWLIDHQMNVRVSQRFGNVLVRVPLVKMANIVQADALRIDWNTVLPAARCSHVLGNPPFRGARLMSAEQKAASAIALAGVDGANNLDLVAGWYVKTARYLSATARAALVSTNSITQGEQVGLLWSWLLRHGVRIHFAHRTFKWQNEAPGQAAVHCVIVGFARHEPAQRRLFDYETVTSNAHELRVGNISPYLIDAGDELLGKRTTPLSPDAPEISFGSMPNDGGHLLLTREERAELLRNEPEAAPWIKPFLGAAEYIGGSTRWCLWLKDISPAELRRLRGLKLRVEATKAHRSQSPRAATRALAATPALFGEDRQPGARYLVIPKTSSERRAFVPIGYLDASHIASTELFTIRSRDRYAFGVLSSTMHNAWIRAVCGRLKSDFRYSASIVYNNFPWPQAPSERLRAAVVQAAEGVLAARAERRPATLADLYDPLTMPVALLRAHRALDRVVDAAYGRRGFESDAQRVAFLFARHQELRDGLQLTPPAAKSGRQPARARRSRALDRAGSVESTTVAATDPDA